MGKPSALSAIMVESAKKVMPSCPVWQLTDLNTEEVPGVDRVERIDLPDLGMVRLNESGDASAIVPAAVMLYRMSLLCALDDEPTITLDTDCIIQKDLGHVFDDEFDIALTYRDYAVIDPLGRDITQTMPFNTGVMFCRNPKVWLDCLHEMHQMSMEFKTWYGDQLAIKKVAANHRLKRLSCDLYNYTPRKKNEDVSEKYVVHYKGLRKAWMIERYLSQDQKDSLDQRSQRNWYTDQSV
jgi:hypothetical protein